MSKWEKVHAILDREVEREVKRVLGKIKAVVGGRGDGNGHTKPIEAKPRKKAASAQRMLHGRFLGISRPLPKGEKERISKIYKEKGVRAAIAEARRSREAMK